jgi:hypothetical protein
MAIHAPLIRVWSLGWVVLAIIAIALGLSAIARRRGLSRLQRMKANLIVTVPTRGQSSGGKPMRHFVWGVVVVLIVLAALTASVRPSRVYKFDPLTNQWGPDISDPAIMIAQAENHTVVLAQPPQPPKPPHKPKNWLKPDRPAAVDSGPRWQATIEQSTFPSVRELNPRDKLLETIAQRLESDLHLPGPPPREFVANQQWVRVAKTERKTLEEKDPKYGDVLVITSDVELTPDGWRELGRLERADRSQSRMELAAGGLGLLTILLGAIAAYIRLDDWTKGYYSGRLFLLATLVVGGFGAVAVYLLKSLGSS